MDICLRVLKESNKSRFDSYSVRNSELIVSHITFRDYRVLNFSDNLPRNSCIPHSNLSTEAHVQLYGMATTLRMRITISTRVMAAMDSRFRPH